MNIENVAGTGSYTFLPLGGRSASTLAERESQEYLMKWGMFGRLRAQTFTFDENFRAYDRDNFVRQFFTSLNVANCLEVNGRYGGASSVLGQPKGLTVAEIEDVPATHTTMALFDRLEGPVVRETGGGHLRKCFDDYFEEILISDELRSMLLMEESENYLLYDEQERSEFLFRIFSHLCIGGQVCQFEDVIGPYLDLTKSLYKDVISVQKETVPAQATSSGDQATAAVQRLRVISHVYRVVVKDDIGLCFPENDHINSFAYLIVDPLRRHVTTLYHSFGVGKIDI